MQSRGRMQIDRIRPGSAGPGYPHGGGPGSPYNRGHAQGHTSYGHRNPKPLYHPSRKYEILREAGRLATEYLVTAGALPPNPAQRNWTNSNFQGPNGNFQDLKGQVSQNAPFGDPRGPQDGRRRFDDDHDRYRMKKNGRGRRHKGFFRKDSFDWERDKGRNSNSNSRGYSEEDEEEEEYQRYRREKRETNFDEVGSRISGSMRPVKKEGKGESGSDLEDTGSKASSCSIRKDQQRETGEVSNGETGEVNRVEPEKMDTDKVVEEGLVNVPDTDPHVVDDEKDSNGNKTLLKYCEFAKIPTKPRSIAHNNNNNNRGQLVDPNINEENRSINPIENEDIKEEAINSFAQPIILEEEEEIKRDEEMVESIEEEKTGTDIVSETDVDLHEEQEEKGFESTAASFKTCDLNLTGMGEITEIPDDPIPLPEDNKDKILNLGDFVIGKSNDNNVENNNNNGGESSSYQFNEINENDKVVQVIHIEDDSPAQPKENVEEIGYQNAENILTNITNEDVVIPSIQDGFNLTLSDYLGTDIACYPIQPDLQTTGIIPGVDDPIYGSLGDIGFMWDQPTQDYERFF